MDSTLNSCRMERENGAVLPLPSSLTIGRSTNNDLVLATDKVSRRHASVETQNGGEFWLIDFGSVNGTFLNGRRVVQPLRLADRDVIAIAGEHFTFRDDRYGNNSDELSKATGTVPPVKSERRWLWAADIEEFSQLSQRLDAQQLAIAVGKWVRDSREVVEKQGGVINRYFDDGYLAFWRDTPGVTQQIVAALRANQALQAIKEPKFRLALHFDTVLFGGAASLREECLMGPEVDFLFRMEKVAGALRAPIMFSDAARAEIEALLLCESVPGEHELNGFSEQQRFHVPKRR
jgi:adenylate cyclase